MPETRKQAKARAKTLGFPQRNVVKGKRGWFIAPRGETAKQMRVYAGLRSKGMSKARAAAISHSI